MNKTRFLLLNFLLSGIFAHAQTSYVKGIVMDARKVPIEYANVVLYDAADSTEIVKAVTTDRKGRFELLKISHGNYRLQASCVGYVAARIRIDNLVENIQDLQLVMQEKAVTLDETTVTAQRVVMEFDRQIIYPGKFEKENAMDGVELVDKMRLHGIVVDMATNSIKTLRDGAVQLRINGGPADLNDVRGLDPKLVTRVEYHDMPSMRYDGAGAVIDFYVKRKESGGTAKLFTYNAVDCATGTESGSIKVNHRKSEFFFSGGNSYAHFNERYSNKTTTYNFEGDRTLVREEAGLPSKYHEDIYNGAVSYSYFDPKNVLFTTKLNYSFYGTPNKGTGNGAIYEGQQPAISKQTATYYRDKKARYSLYYQKEMKHKQLLALEVMGSYVYTGSHRSYRETQEGNTLTDILSDADGDTYLITAEGLYERRFGKRSKLTAGVTQYLNLADISYSGTTGYQSEMDRFSTSGYAEWMSSTSRFNYSGGVRGRFERILQKAGNNSSFSVAPSLRMGYRFGRNVQLRYSGTLSVSVPSLRNLNDVEVVEDGYQARRGNPRLGTITNYLNSLLFTWYSGDLMTTLNVSDSYTVHPVLGSIFRENDRFITQYGNGKYDHTVNVEAGGDWSAFDRRLNIYGRIGYSFRENAAEDYSHSLNSWYYNVGINWTYRNLTLSGSANRGANSLSNEVVRYSGKGGIGLGLDYKWKNLKLGGGVNFAVGHSYLYQTKSLNRFVLSDERMYDPEGNTMFRIRMSWNIKFGRQRESNYQRIENSGGESAVF